jgi:carboxylate-amine ligase
MTSPTFGIEEEFLLCAEDTGELRQDAEEVLSKARQTVDDGLDHELRTAMLETGTAVCVDARSAERDLRIRRQASAEAAAEVGARVLATASHPDASTASVGYSDEERYRAMAEWFGPIADQSLVCGCHVHVAIPDRQTGVAVIDRLRPWLPPLIAMSANSPIWQGRDTGFDSWRTQIWSRWPTSGPTSLFGSLEQYELRADALVESRAALDRAGLYYQARLSEKWPTVEVRVGDVCLDVDDAVLLGVLVRALVTTASRHLNEPAADVPSELIRAATFRASRSGLGDQLLDPRDGRPRSARDVVDQLMRHVRDALDDSGDHELAAAGVDRLFRNGTGADRQRASWRRGGAEAVLDLVALSDTAGQPRVSA